MAAGDVVTAITPNNGRKCVVFDGSSNDLSLTNAIGDKINETNNITIAFWFKVNEFSNAYSYFWAKDSDMVRIFIKRDTGEVTINYFGLTDNAINYAGSLADGEWHHLSTSYNGSAIKLWVDGVERDNDASTGTMQDTGDPVHIGSYDGTQLYLPGEMADIRVWNRGLTDEEKVKIYQGQDVTEDLIFRLNFQDDTYTDLTGNYVVTNNGAYISIIDDAIKIQMESQRTTANDTWLVEALPNGEFITATIEEAP